MPELPEVETIRRGLARHLRGRTITSVEVTLPKLVAAAPDEGLGALVGRKVGAVRRRAKLLALHCDGFTLLLHLRLTGQLVFEDGATRFAGGHPMPALDAPAPTPVTHLTVRFGPAALYLNDQRQFARLWLLPTQEARRWLSAQRFGPDALDPRLTALALARRLARHPRLTLKGALLDQRCVAGLGNMYVDESLFLAALHPARPAGGLAPEQHERLLAAMRRAVAVAIAHGGAVVINGRAVPVTGKDFLFVHGRAGLPCRVCGTIIGKERVAGRGTHVCPTCQPAG